MLLGCRAQRVFRRVGLLVVLGAPMPWLGSSCETLPQESASGTVTATITLDRERSVSVDSFVPVEVLGRSSLAEVRAKLEATITASSASRAERLLDTLTIEVDQQNPEVLGLLVRQPQGAPLTGLLSLELPADLALKVIARSGVTVVQGMQNDIEVVAKAGAQVEDARADLDVAVQSGNISVDSRLLPGSQLVAETGSGDVELRLPSAVSAAIEAVAEGGGQVYIQHPALPPPFGGQTTTNYRASVSGGLAIVRALTQQGNIFIRTR